MKTAVKLFAERGYEATSIRTLAAKAHVNQAAIKYHFKTKDGLYGEVSRDAIPVLTEDQLSHAQETQAMPGSALLANSSASSPGRCPRATMSPGISTLNWEAVQPTEAYRKPVSEEAAPFLGFAVDLMRRFMPEADQGTLTMAAVWLVGQCTVFICYREQLAMPPVSRSLTSLR